ncbi:MAG: amidohydrolase family protein, partial [Alphaproteobacteria bacterium]
GLAVLGSRTTDEDYSNVLSSLKRPHGEYFKMFYGDTAMFGSSSAFPTGMEYFGPDHVCFSTDAPFAPVAETFESLKRMEYEADVQKKLYKENAEKLMNRTFG